MDQGNEPISAAEAAAALQWWSDAGVNCIAAETPHDWLRAKLPAPVAPKAPPEEPAPSPELPPQLDMFRAYLAESDALPFAAPDAKRICPSGDPGSGLMLLSDMPASEDCAAGTLLSGEAGQLFDRMLAAIGRDRSSIYLAALSCLRSPGGGFTEPSATHCASLARHHIGLAAPRAVLLLGDNCCKALLGMAVMQARGRWHQISTHAGDIPAMASFHPSYLLDQPSAKKHAWADLLMLVERLEQ